jgi:6-phosphogluconolactonase/glucosamine-6-phosphate isomerase/deaminase
MQGGEYAAPKCLGIFRWLYSGEAAMQVRIFADADSVAREAATLIAAEAKAAVAARGAFVMAVSGGRTPWVMPRALASEDVPWKAVHVMQVDERVASAGNPDRNLTMLVDREAAERVFEWYESRNG